MPLSGADLVIIYKTKNEQYFARHLLMRFAVDCSFLYCLSFAVTSLISRQDNLKVYTLDNGFEIFGTVVK